MVGLILLGGALVGAGGQESELAGRRFETGLTFARDGRYTEALTDFEAIVELYPSSSVADNALLELARMQLEVTGDLDLADDFTRRIVDDAGYSQADAAPEAYVLLARIALARGHTLEHLDSALVQLQRGLGLWPEAPAAAQALFFVGEVHRLGGRYDAALATYAQVRAEHGSTPWAARAGVESGVLRAIGGDPVSGMEELQQVRDRWPDTADADAALAGITILYRLYVRSPDRAFPVVEELLSTPRMRRVDELIVDGAGRVFYATDREVGSTDPAASPLPASDRPRGLALNGRGVVTAILRDRLAPATAPAIPLVVSSPGRNPEGLREIDAAGVTSTGDWLVMDGDEREIHRFSAAGEYRGAFTRLRVKRLTVGSDDRVAVIDRDDRIRLLADDGREIGELPRRGPGYEIDDPIAVAFDVFGHLYVADEERVFVFGREQQLLLRYPDSDDVPDAPRKITAFAIDRFGSLLIADDDADRIVSYR